MDTKALSSSEAFDFPLPFLVVLAFCLTGVALVFGLAGVDLVPVLSGFVAPVAGFGVAFLVGLRVGFEGVVGSSFSSTVGIWKSSGDLANLPDRIDEGLVPIRVGLDGVTFRGAILRE